MIWKTLISLALLAILVEGYVWVSNGMQIYTKDREKVVTVVKDELFGTSREDVTWVENFKLGLLPDDLSITVLHRSYAFVIGASAFAIALSVFMLRRRRTA